MSVSWPLAFTGAFQAHLTGLDNLKFVCRVYGVDWKPLVPFVEEFTELGLYLREPVDALLGRHDDAAGVRAVDGDRVRLLPDRRGACRSATRASAIAATSSCSRSARTAPSSWSRTTRTSSSMYCERACVLHEGRLHEFETVDEAYEFYEIGCRAGSGRRVRLSRGVKVLLELRPALDGHSGIPQETRLLFRGLAALDGVEVVGPDPEQQPRRRGRAAGARRQARCRCADERAHRPAVAGGGVAAAGPGVAPPRAPAQAGCSSCFGRPSRVLASLFGGKVSLGGFDRPLQGLSSGAAMFAKSLPDDDFELVTTPAFRVLRWPWSMLHAIGVASAAVRARALSAARHARHRRDDGRDAVPGPRRPRRRAWSCATTTPFRC